MKLNTVNVIQSIDGTVKQVLAYADTPNGNKQAESAFKQICIENGLTDENEIAICIENGVAPDLKGSDSWELFLVHSE